MKTKDIKRAALGLMVAIWGIVTFACFFADDCPGSPMTDTAFVATKLFAICSLYGLVKFCKSASKKGLL